MNLPGTHIERLPVHSARRSTMGFATSSRRRNTHKDSWIVFCEEKRELSDSISPSLVSSERCIGNQTLATALKFADRIRVVQQKFVTTSETRRTIMGYFTKGFVENIISVRMCELGRRMGCRSEAFWISRREMRAAVYLQLTSCC